MNIENQISEGYITVIPYHRDCETVGRNPVVVNKLYFWCNKTFNHPITDETIAQFLLHVKMFGATVYPDHPEKGCCAINGDTRYNPGEASVNEIHYKGTLIYCRG